MSVEWITVYKGDVLICGINTEELLGFVYFFSIGKLFKSEDLTDFVRFFLMFYKDKPVDLLLGDIFLVKMCTPGEALVSISLLCILRKILSLWCNYLNFVY